MKIILCLLLILPLLLFSQETSTVESSDTVGVEAEFPGGDSEMKKFLCRISGKC